MKICRGRQSWNRGQITSVRGWRKDPEERELARQFVYSANVEGREGELDRVPSEWFKELVKVGAGGTYRVEMGAPGGGWVKYMITRITKTRVFGKMIEDQSYILEPYDVI